MTLRYKADERSIHIAVIMDQNETSTVSATLSDEQIFLWDQIFENVLAENSSFSTTSRSMNSTLPVPGQENSISNPIKLWHWCVIVIVGAIFVGLISTLVLVYKRAHSELTRLLAVQSDVEKGIFAILIKKKL